MIDQIFFSACEIGDHETVLELLNTGEPLAFQRDVNRQTGLMKAAKNGHAEIVKLLIKKGSSLDIQDKDGLTPLMMASYNIVEILNSHGANIHTQDNEGMTALTHASLRKDERSVQILTEYAANIAISN